jgi:hypothetical protein
VCEQELATATRGVAAGGGSGSRGTRGGGQQGRGTGPGQGERDAWRSIQQEVERQRRHSSDGEGLCTGGRGGRAEQHVLEEEEERRGAEGPMCKTKRF